MAWQAIGLRDIRNLEAFEAKELGRKVWICGGNAQGKTSFLEAIHLLSRGRSFRSGRSSEWRRNGSKQSWIYGEWNGTPERRVGLAWSDEGQQLHLNGQESAIDEEFLRAIPITAVTPQDTDSVERGPEYRRKRLDWGLFHVEQGYADVWRRYRRALRQLQSEMAHGGRAVAGWAAQAAGAGEDLAVRREAYFLGAAPIFRDLLCDLLDTPDISLRHERGWGRGLSLNDVFQKAAASRARNTLLPGPHRADWKVDMNGRPLSRGQQKLVLVGFALGQLLHMEAKQGRRGVLLVDDVLSELDAQHRSRLVDLLLRVPQQVFATATDIDAVRSCVHEPAMQTWFHVERGLLTRV